MRDLRDRDRHRVESEGQRRALEVPVGEDLTVIGEHQRVVGGAVEIGDQRIGEQLQRRDRGAVDLAGAAEAQRVLQAPR